MGKEFIEIDIIGSDILIGADESGGVFNEFEDVDATGKVIGFSSKDGSRRLEKVGGDSQRKWLLNKSRFLKENVIIVRSPLRLGEKVG